METHRRRADGRRYFTAEFKQEQLARVAREELTFAELSRELAVAPSVLRRWHRLSTNGSATACEGIWSRWCAYSITGHGGNRELKRLLKAEGDAYADNFHFGILEIADTHASQEDILSRESYWKDLLQSRAHGYNAN